MSDATPAARADVAVIGGSGLYELIDEAVEVTPVTPWGRPSGPITVGHWAGQRVAFLPRHGPDHRIPPHRIPARANLWALRELGVTRVIGPCAVGAVDPALAPGDLVVLDQLVDRTRGRCDTYLDGDHDGTGGAPDPVVEHVGFADPYCPELRAALLAGAASLPGTVVHPTGTVVVIAGPRFSTRAESHAYRAMGWSVVNMTQYPEAYLARELGLCYGGLALVTDRDSGAADGSEPPVDMATILAVLAANAERTRAVLEAALPALASRRGCDCRALGAPSLTS